MDSNNYSNSHDDNDNYWCLLNTCYMHRARYCTLYTWVRLALKMKYTVLIKKHIILGLVTLKPQNRDNCHNNN